MLKIKTDRQHLIELRDTVCARRIEALASAKYWHEVSKKAKTDTQERVDAQRNKSNNEMSAKKDKIYLKVIDKMIESNKDEK